MEMVWGGLVETNRVGFCVLVYPRSSWRERRGSTVWMWMCVFALLLHPTHISFIGCAALVLEGPGQPWGQQVWPRCATVLECIKARAAQE